MVNIPDRSQTAGIASQYSESITEAAKALFTGHEPAALTVDMTVAASQTIPALTPVGFDGSGDLVPAVSGGGSPIAAIGITVCAVTTPGSGTKKAIPVYRGGCFNPDALNWPASYDTDAEKFGAFNGAPTPTNIIIRRPKTASV